MWVHAIWRFAVLNQTVLEVQSGKVRSASSDLDSYFVPRNVVSICDSSAFANTAKDPVTGSDRDGLGCFRGVQFALIAEFAAALLAYCAWHLWQILR